MNLTPLPNHRIYQTQMMRGSAVIIDAKTGHTVLDEVPRFVFDWIVAIDKSGTISLGQAGRNNLVVTNLRTAETQMIWKADRNVSWIRPQFAAILSPDRALLINQEGHADDSAEVQIRILPIPAMP